MIDNIKETEIVDPYGFIYITTNKINGKKYIGQRIFNKNLKGYLGSGKLLKQAVRKYGKENFFREIIAISYSKEESDKLEIYFIKEHNAVVSEDYYNISIGGGTNAGLHFSDEHRQKMSESRRGILNCNFGRTLSNEHKNKISEGCKDEKHHDFGKLRSEETKQKISKKLMKLNLDQVKEIRTKYSTRNYMQIDLAKEYCVDQTTISNVINYKGVYKVA